MDISIKIFLAILSLAMLVFLHELGHFMFARLFKTRVEKFYLFFNPWFSLLKFKRGDTEYGIGWIPLGGYVKIAGMVDESMDTDQLAQPPQPDEFRSKPAWQRLLVMTGGVMMNILFAMLIYIGMTYAWGDQYIATKDIKYGYTFNELGHQIGLQDGDKITHIDKKRVEDYSEIVTSLILDQPQSITVQRGDSTLAVAIPQEAVAKLLKSSDFLSIRLPLVIDRTIAGEGAARAGLQHGDTLITCNGEIARYMEELQLQLGQHKGGVVTLGISRDSAGVRQLLYREVAVSTEGVMGAYFCGPNQLINISTREYSFWQSIPKGIQRTATELSNYGKQLRLIFSPKTEAYKSLGGVIAIGNLFPSSWNWQHFWHITALLSIIFAVMNILPIPALDGGHVLFLLFEVITRRKPSEKFLSYAQSVGLILVLLLILFANGNDIYRFFIK